MHVLFVALMLWPAHLHQDGLIELWVWNVGQGSWATESSPNLCRHFDAGGERLSWKRLWDLCRGKRNEIYLSHGDWDHIRWVPAIASRLGNACLINRPKAGVSNWKTHHLDRVPDCSLPFPSPDVEEVHATDEAQGANESSRVYLLRNQVLFPGDSPISEEKKWSRKLTGKKIKILILGHHGSQTSTSVELLSRLPHLKMAVASSRSARYGHPHAKTLRRLKQKKIPVLKTEELGNIRVHLELESAP